MPRPVHTDNYLWFGDFMCFVLQAIQRGATVTRHCSLHAKGPAIELEVRVVSVDGKPLPRVPEITTRLPNIDQKAPGKRSPKCK